MGDQSENKEPRGRFRRFMARVPLASMVAFNMCITGAVVFTVCLYMALMYAVNTFDIPVVRPVIWSLLTVHIVMALTLLFMGVMSTSKTRSVAFQKMNRLIGFKMTIIVAKGTHIVGIVIAYIFHFMWLLLPAVLLIVVAIVTGVGIGCQYIPDCISPSDIGIPPRYIEKAQIISSGVYKTIKKFNVTEVQLHINITEDTLVDILDRIQKSRVIDNISEAIETIIPGEEVIRKMEAHMVDYVDDINTEKYILWLEVNTDMFIDTFVNETNNLINLVKNITDSLDLDQLMENVSIAGIFDGVEAPGFVGFILNQSFPNTDFGKSRDVLNQSFPSTDLSKSHDVLNQSFPRPDLSKSRDVLNQSFKNITGGQSLDYDRIISYNITDQRYKLEPNNYNITGVKKTNESGIYDVKSVHEDTNYLLKAKEKVRELAGLIKTFTTDFMIQLRESIEWLKETIVTQVHNAADLAVDLVSSVRHIANNSIEWARFGTREAARRSRCVLNNIDKYRLKVIDSYDIVEFYVDKLNITKEKDDRYCSQTKRVICDELHKSSICFILVFLAAILLNLSMVHWLMVLSSNYVHIKQECIQMMTGNNNLNRHIYKINTEKKCGYHMTDSGSMSLLTET